MPVNEIISNSKEFIFVLVFFSFFFVLGIGVLQCSELNTVSYILPSLRYFFCLLQEKKKGIEKWRKSKCSFCYLLISFQLSHRSDEKASFKVYFLPSALLLEFFHALHISSWAWLWKKSLNHCCQWDLYFYKKC